MKPQEMRLQFVQMRAEGLSYDKIAAALHISKATCTAWERELRPEVNRLQHESLTALYTAYGMQKEARIKRLGDTLQRIEDALERVDLAAIPPEKLLDYKLKYAQALREEYTGATPPPIMEEGGTPPELQAAFADIYQRVRRGDITAEQAGQEIKTLSAIMAANDAAETQARINAIDSIIEGRGA